MALLLVYPHRFGIKGKKHELTFAAAGWAGYAVLSQKISSYGYNTIQTTRRIFTYGILFMLPVLFRFETEVQCIR